MDRPEKDRAKLAYPLTLAAVLGQVGCLTLVIILAALFGGLWLDARLQTRPFITVVLMIASIPVTLALMFWVVRTTTSRYQARLNNKADQTQEEKNGGKT